MKRTLVYVAVICFFSCAEKLMAPPENLIPKEKMVNILRDMAVLNAARTTNATILRRNNVEPMSYLYAKHGIDSAQLSESDFYYASLPEVYEDIYTKVEARLEAEKEAIEESKRVNDSLKAKANEKKRKATRPKDSLP